MKIKGNLLRKRKIISVGGISKMSVNEHDQSYFVEEFKRISVSLLCHVSFWLTLIEEQTI